MTVLLGGLALWHYLRSWITFIYYVFPSSRSIAFFQDFAQADVKWAWGLLIGAHIGIAAIAAIIGLMFHLFPTITAESQGLILLCLAARSASAGSRSRWSNLPA